MPGELDVAEDRDLWERLPVALFRTTPDGRVLDVNHAFVDCFRGPSREALLGTQAESLYVDPEDGVRSRAFVQSKGLVRGFETLMCRLDGTTFWGRESPDAVPAGGAER
jgi:two-component system cell cycle sensor histidine kinase/response regulator CckA